MSALPPGPPAVGFDLDLTLIDSRAGIAATFRALTAETGVAIDADEIITRLGPPLRDELSRWFPADRVDEAVRRYRELYPHHALAPTRPMAGATESLDAVRSAGARILIITAKHEPLARLHLAVLGMSADAVVGDAWGGGKAAALRAHRAGIYVGDHVEDVRAAASAGVVGVGVCTGPCTAQALAVAGAQVVLADLTEFPAWFTGHGWCTVRSGTGIGISGQRRSRLEPRPGMTNLGMLCVSRCEAEVCGADGSS